MRKVANQDCEPGPEPGGWNEATLPAKQLRYGYRGRVVSGEPLPIAALRSTTYYILPWVAASRKNGVPR